MENPDRNGAPTVLKADGHLLEIIEAFLLSRRVGNCTERTLATYRDDLLRFAQTEGTFLACPPVAVQAYLTHLRDQMKPITVHQHFRVLRTFFGWCVETGLIGKNPMRGLTVKVPKSLPRVPEDEEISRLPSVCPDAFEGRRNKALVSLLADSGLRISEALRLRIEDVNFSTRTLAVKGGKGQKDRVGFFGAETAQVLRAWIRSRRDAHLEPRR